MSPMVVVAGRPNVGKSSLVNRIVGSRAAVVEEEQGVTRDRKVLDAEWAGVPFSMMDTGGWLAGGDALDAKVSAQAERALAEADVVLMVVDVTTGVTEEDLAAAKVIRRAGPPVRLVVNKVDDANREAPAWEFVALGLGDPFPVSALHGRGTGDLLDEVVGLLPVAAPRRGRRRLRRSPTSGERRQVDHGTPRVAIIGRPNVGKSTLFNRLLGRGALHRARHAGDDPRRHRHGGRDARRPGLLHRHRRACAARPRPIGDTSSTPPCAPCGPSSGPTSPSWSSTPRWVPRTRTSAWPSASACRGARPSSC